jgi:hypothetical protein
MKRPQKQHLFARTCRVIGRFLLAVGAVLCVASAIMALSPVLIPQSATPVASHSKSIPSAIIPDSLPTKEPSTINASSNQYIIPAICVVVIVLFILALAFRHYNDTIRTYIARSAKIFRTEIHVAELILATLIWTVANLIIVFNTPVFVILTLPALIINDLFFIFAWTSYGCPAYSI